jgi:excisionase family DNA binding protein
VNASAERLGAVLDAFVRELVADEVARQLDARGEADCGAAGSPWLALDEAATYLRISVRTLERWIAKGRVRSTTIGRRRLLHRDDLDALAAAGEETAPTAPPRRRTGVN